MRKFCYGVLFLICAPLMADPSTGITKPSVTIGGKALGFAAGVSSKTRYAHTPSITAGTKGNLRFDINAQSLAGTEYGAVVELDLRRQKVSSPDLYRAMYVFASSPEYGMWQLGEVDGAIMQGVVDGTSLMGGTGGFDGEMWNYVTITTGVLPSVIPTADTKYATKLVYKSPLVQGVQLTLSYTPQSRLYGTRDRGPGEDFANDINKSKATLSKVTEAVLSYGFSLGDVGINLYAGGSLATPTLSKDIFAGADAVPYYDVRTGKTLRFGMLIDWKALQFAAGLTNNQFTLKRTTDVGNAGTAYNAAVSYNMGKHTVAAGYFGSRRAVIGGKAQANVGSVTYEYSVAPGWTLWAEGNVYETKNTAQYLANYTATPGAAKAKSIEGFLYSTDLTSSARGGVVLLGTTVRF